MGKYSEVPFKINFLMLRCIKGRIAIEDNLKRFKVQMALRCHCCEEYEEEKCNTFF